MYRISDGIRRTAHIALSSVLFAGCDSQRAAGAKAPETEQAGAPETATPHKESAVAQGVPSRTLAEATPANPLRPKPPPGPTIRSEPGAPSSSPPKLDALTLPDGFAIEVYTNEVPHARSLALGPKGVVFVSTRRDNRVYAVVDSNGDHEVDAVHTIAEGLDTPNGIAYREGDLYIAEISRVLRLEAISKRLDNPPEPQLVTKALPEDHHHGWRYIRFGPDDKLYVPVGAPCNNCLRDKPIFASIARMNPDGSGLEVFAQGVRNSVGFDWHPQTKELWFTENGRDELGNDLPPDELNRAPKEGMHFGFPHCHAGVILDPEFGQGHECTEFEPPVQNLGPHVAALGMRFYTGKMFPERYHNAVILAEHGSWNRENKIGYRVMVVPIENNQSKGYEKLVSGFLDQDKGQVWGRPVDLEVLEDGSLLVSDDWKGALYRVTYSG